MTNANTIERSAAGSAVRFRIELGQGTQSMTFNGVPAQVAGAVLAATVYRVQGKYDVIVSVGNPVTREGAIIYELNQQGFIDHEAAEAYAVSCLRAGEAFWNDSVVEG